MALGQIETNYSFQEDYKTEDINLKDALEKSGKYINPELKAAKDIIDQGGDTNEIKKLNPKLANMLVSKLQGQEYIELSGLKNLDEATARELAKFNGKYLVFSGLKELNVDTATALVNFNGKLVFNLNLLYGEGGNKEEGNKTQKILSGKFIDSKTYIQDRIGDFIKQGE